MKKLIMISIGLISLSSLLIAKNPVYQTLTITNHTSMPLTIKLSSAVQSSSGKTITDKKSINIAPESSANFNYRVNKFISRNSITYRGGLESMQVFKQKNSSSPIATYYATEGSDGRKYFTGQMPSGFSYNLLSIYPSSSSIYLSYDGLKVAVR